MESSKKVGSAVWSTEEIRQAIRRKKQLLFCYPGLTGQILEVFDTPLGTRLTVQTVFPGKAYLSSSSILTAAPVRLGIGALVQTAFGPGVVLEFRQGLYRLDYVVELVGSALATTNVGKLGVAFIDADEVFPRSRIYSEFLIDAESFRARGNAAYTAKNWEDALAAYTATIGTVSEAYQSIKPTPSAESMVKLLESAVRSAANLSQVYLSMPEPNFELAQRHAEEGLQMDRKNVTKHHEKLLYRRAMALLGQKDYEAAAETLRLPLLAENKEARHKLAFAVSELKRQEKEMWGGKLAGAASPLSTSGTSPVSSPRKVSTTATKASPVDPNQARRATPFKQGEAKAKAVLVPAAPIEETSVHDGTAVAEADGSTDESSGSGLLIAAGLVVVGVIAAAAFFWGRSGSSIVKSTNGAGAAKVAAASVVAAAGATGRKLR